MLQYTWALSRRLLLGPPTHFYPDTHTQQHRIQLWRSIWPPIANLVPWLPFPLTPGHGKYGLFFWNGIKRKVNRSTYCIERHLHLLPVAMAMRLWLGASSEITTGFIHTTFFVICPCQCPVWHTREPTYLSYYHIDWVSGNKYSEQIASSGNETPCTSQLAFALRRISNSRLVIINMLSV